MKWKEYLLYYYPPLLAASVIQPYETYFFSSFTIYITNKYKDISSNVSYIMEIITLSIFLFLAFFPLLRRFLYYNDNTIQNSFLIKYRLSKVYICHIVALMLLEASRWHRQQEVLKQFTCYYPRLLSVGSSATASQEPQKDLSDRWPIHRNK